MSGIKQFPNASKLLRSFKCHARKGNLLYGQNDRCDDDGSQGGFPVVLPVTHPASHTDGLACILGGTPLHTFLSVMPAEGSLLETHIAAWMWDC